MDEVFVGLDVGTKTIGLARADVRSGLATPKLTLGRRGVKQDVARLLETVGRWGVVVQAWVVGLPLELDGAEGRSCRLARQIGAALAEATGVPVHYQDERFSTTEATRRLRERGLDGRQIRQQIDHAAAAVILEDWLKARAPD